MQKQHSRTLLQDLLCSRVRNASRIRNPGGKSPIEECFDGLARITPKELAPIHSVKSGILLNACSTRCRFGEKCSYAHRQVDEQPSKSSNKNGDKSAVAMSQEYTTIGLRISGYGAAEVFIDFAEELKHTETNPMCKIHESRCTSC